ncbi:MAG: 2OG-Fe(II) oxygenase [Rhizomicrobium sp.]
MGTVDTIGHGALSGELTGMLDLGKRALSGTSAAHTPQEGARILVSAAEKGSAEADEIISVVIATDAKDPKDWSLALGYVQRAAERGSALARDQLCLLASDRELACAAAAGRLPDGGWERLRDTIDIAACLNSPNSDVISESPRIRVIEGFASAGECKWMMARGSRRLGRAAVFNQTRGGTEMDDSRSNSAMLFNILDTDFVLALLRARIANSTRFARPSLEETNVLHYATGQEFTRHFDFYDPAREANAAEIAAKGQRVGTFLLYLNADFDGAETDFPVLDWCYRGRPGDALFFMNVDDKCLPDRRTMHAGLMPKAGEKWLLSQWIRGTPGVGL